MECSVLRDCDLPASRRQGSGTATRNEYLTLPLVNEVRHQKRTAKGSNSLLCHPNEVNQITSSFGARYSMLTDSPGGLTLDEFKYRIWARHSKPLDRDNEENGVEARDLLPTTAEPQLFGSFAVSNGDAENHLGSSATPACITSQTKDRYASTTQSQYISATQLTGLGQRYPCSQNSTPYPQSLRESVTRPICCGLKAARSASIYNSALIKNEHCKLGHKRQAINTSSLTWHSAYGNSAENTYYQPFHRHEDCGPSPAPFGMSHSCSPVVSSPRTASSRSTDNSNLSIHTSDTFHIRHNCYATFTAQHLFTLDSSESKFLQEQFLRLIDIKKCQFLRQILPHSRYLMTHRHGNYLIQKMLEVGTPSHNTLIVDQIQGHMLALCKDQHGCWVIQKALTSIQRDQKVDLVREFIGHVVELVMDSNASYVISKAIACLSLDNVEFIVYELQGHIAYLSRHKSGCRVIQSLLDFCTHETKWMILAEIYPHIDNLIQDTFGNYVIQHIIEHGQQDDREFVIDQVSNNLIEHSMHKFGSNVVEKALDYANEAQRSYMLQELTAYNQMGESLSMKLLDDRFGNYVIQKIISYLQGPELKKLTEVIEQYIRLPHAKNDGHVARLREISRSVGSQLDHHREHSRSSASATEKLK